MGFGETGEDVNVGCLKDKEVKYPMDMEDGFDDDTFSDFIQAYKKVCGLEMISYLNVLSSMLVRLSPLPCIFGVVCVLVLLSLLENLLSTLNLPSADSTDPAH